MIEPVPILLYAGTPLSGRTTSLAHLVAARVAWTAEGQEELASGVEIRTTRGLARVRIAYLHQSNLWFDSIASQAQSQHPVVRASAQRVLDWADRFTGAVLVMDSQEARMHANLELVERIARVVDLDRVRLVFQLNKRDLPTALPVEEMKAQLGRRNATYVETVATTGRGVRAALDAVLGVNT